MSDMSVKEEIVLDHTGYVGHGNTPAAWACLGILLLGILLAITGHTLPNAPLMWVGVVVAVVGLIVGAVMKAMGMGYEGVVKKHQAGRGH